VQTVAAFVIALGLVLVISAVVQAEVSYRHVKAMQEQRPAENAKAGPLNREY
jgi:hypothetical protein